MTKIPRGGYAPISITVSMDDGEMRWAGANSSTSIGGTTRLKEVVWRRNMRTASNISNVEEKLTDRQSDFVIISFLKGVEIV